MRKADLLLVFGSSVEIARQFAPFNNGEPLSRAAISEWDLVPELRQFQLRASQPDIDERIRIARAKRRNGCRKAA